MNAGFVFVLALVLSVFAAMGQTQQAAITVRADQSLHPISRYLTGACLEDVNHEVYGGIYSQMIFGESFQEPAASNQSGAVSAMWTPIHTGSAEGQWALQTSNLPAAAQCQRLTFTWGAGEIGIANQGLNHWGMSFLKGKPYEGCLELRADAPTYLWVALENADGSIIYAKQSLSVTSANWQRLDFTLTPSASGNNGRFSIKLKKTGSVALGYAFLQPGPWGRFQGLPVRNDVANGLIQQGVTVLRYGGAMINAPGYRWKKMIGPREHRPPYKGTWYPYASDGWGILDFLNFSEAAGFLGVPAFNMGETPRDMADFMEYLNGAGDSSWGARRIADGHPQPYNLKYMELGNEETVDASYFQKFQALAQAIWARDSNIILVVGDYLYSQPITNPFHFTGAGSGITTLAAHQQILQLAKQYHRAVWFDVHVGTEGPTPDSSLAGVFSFDDALGKIAAGADYKVVVFELNAQNHSQRRALANAVAINAAERDGRVPIVTSANCLQPDRQNNNGWDQGLLFLNPSQVWLQPPGYVTRMISRDYEPTLVQCEVSPADSLQASAKRSENGKTLVLTVINLGEEANRASIIIHGYSPTQSVADIEELSAPLDATNTATAPTHTQPISTQWRPHFENGSVDYNFKPRSLTLIKFH